MKVQITQANSQDSLELSIMTGELLHEIMDKINIKAFNFNQEETQNRAKELLSKGVYFVLIAKDEEEYLGFISMYESYALYAEGAYGTIPELYVREKYRSLNIGKLLLKNAKKFSTSKDWKRLEVTTPPLPEFQRTLSFYENNKFEVSGGRKMKFDMHIKEL